MSGGALMSPPELALVAALEAEAAPLLRSVSLTESVRLLGQPVYRGQLDGHGVLIAELGVGKVRAAAVLQALIDRYRFHSVICLGSAGAINPALTVGDIIVAQRVTQHDYKLISKPSVLGGHLEWIKTDKRLSTALLAAGQRIGKPVVSGGVITGDVVVVTREARERLWEAFHADGVEMEGAAIGLVCALNDIPFALVRGLTDNADEDAIGSFKQRIRDVSASVAQVVVEYVRTMV